MADAHHVLAMLAVSSTITWALRALPFALLAPMRRSALVRYFSVHMPLGVMVMLAAYTLHDVLSSADTRRTGAATLALIVSVGLHLWKRNVLLSIVGGTTVNVLIVSVL
jgi:branched-subunit amino acid transport protein AzlD